MKICHIYYSAQREIKKRTKYLMETTHRSHLNKMKDVCLITKYYFRIPNLI